jgi:uncharacterized protein (DUF58 family)
MTAPRTAALAVALGLVVVGVLLTDGTYFAMALPLAAWSLLGVFFGIPRLELVAERSLSIDFVAAGDPVEVIVRVQNLGPRIDSLELGDELFPGAPVVEGTTAWCGSLDVGGEVVLRYLLQPQRGVYTFTALTACAETPFSAMRTQGVLPCPATLVVFPRSPLLPKAIFGSGAPRAFAGLSKALRQGGGTSFYGTREYTPGDPMRSLNWRAQALWGQEIVNVFEEERAIDVGVILDCRSEAYTDHALFEDAVSAAGSLAETLMKGGNRVAFLCYGDAIRWTPSGTGKEHVLRTRKATAHASLGSHPAFEHFDRLPIGLFPPRSRIVLVSPLRREDVQPLRSLVASGYGVTVLRLHGGPTLAIDVPDETWELARRIAVLEEDILLSRLLQSSIEVLDWDRSRSLASARRYTGRPDLRGGNR